MTRRRRLPRYEVGDRVCVPVGDIDPFTPCIVTSAPHRGCVDLEEVCSKKVHRNVPLTNLVHV